MSSPALQKNLGEEMQPCTYTAAPKDRQQYHLYLPVYTTPKTALTPTRARIYKLK